MDNDSQYKTYREKLDTVELPAIPYLYVPLLLQITASLLKRVILPNRGIFLTDLTFAEESNPETIDGLINFRRSRIVYSIISRIQYFQQKPYRLQGVHQIQEFLISLTPRLGEKELYKRSGMVEPRGADRSSLE